MLTGYVSSQHCSHALVHYTYMCSHMLTHTHTCYSCKWYFLSSLMCAFSFALFCWIKASSCWGFFASDRLGTQGKASVGDREEWVWDDRSTLAFVRQSILRAKHSLVRGGSCKSLLIEPHHEQSTSAGHCRYEHTHFLSFKKWCSVSMVHV